MKKVMSLALAAMMVASAFSGCGGSKSASSEAPASSAAAAESSAAESAPAAGGKDITVVFVPKLTGNAFFESANDGAQAYAEKVGFTVKYDGSPEASVANQVTVINNAIQQGADAVCVSSVDATGLDDVMKQAKDAGLQVVTWDSDVSGDARTVMVSQGTPDILGKMLVEMGVKSLTSRGKDPAKDAINYCWHYSQATVADQNSWQVAGEAYIKATYPNWVNVAPDNYYSEQDAEKAISVGESILSAHKDLDLVICNDSTALPGQCQAAQNLGMTKDDVTITGFASPNSIKDYCKAGVIERWGLWDCQIQGALGCYLAYYLASGNTLKVGDKVDVPDIGTVEVMPNTVLDPNAYTADDSGVVLLPERAEFTAENMDNYNF
ncbi:substrate-binding domain-containing protein [Marasmitruncus massiliensis]|uniref:substrate-binding domain-containing protein n=1 Tax=Marasmitruncus massiliensis TaxID=1944642 RepID=UPI000C7D578D|nr:substrate-binding domain-containing protein [Marasmitruncus massiliensis]